MDHYEILGVSPEDSPEKIRKQYKKLARKYHPDTTILDKDYAEAEFKKISAAYEKVKNGESSEPNMNFFTQKIIEKASRLAELFKKIDKNEVKNVMFQLFTNITAVNPNDSFTDDINVNVHCSIQDIYNKQEKAINLTRLRRCKECAVNSLKYCIECNNKEYVEESKIFTFNCDEKVIVFAGESNEEKGKKPGDINFRIIPKPDDKYSIIDDYNIQLNIENENEVSIKKKFTYLDSKNYLFKIDNPQSQKYVIKNMGLNIPGSKKNGDLIIRISKQDKPDYNFTFTSISEQ